MSSPDLNPATPATAGSAPATHRPHRQTTAQPAHINDETDTTMNPHIHTDESPDQFDDGHRGLLDMCGLPLPVDLPQIGSLGPIGSSQPRPWHRRSAADGGWASLTARADGARLVEATHPDGINVGVGLLVEGVWIDVVWASRDEVAFDLLDCDAVTGLTLDQMLQIGELVTVGVTALGAEFTGVRLVPSDRFENTRLAAPDRSKPFVSWTITDLPAWLDVRP